MANRRSKVHNAYESTLSAAMNSTQLSMDVVAAGPVSADTYLCIEPDSNSQREYVYVSSVSGDTLTLGERYLTGSAAPSGLSHSSGAVVRSVSIQQMWEDVHDRIEFYRTHSNLLSTTPNDHHAEDHAARHAAGAADPFVHAAAHAAGAGDPLAGNLDAIARVTVRKNAGANVGSRRRLNLIEGSGIGLTVADDAAGEEIDVTVANTSPGVTDHGALAGLADDDHPQYYNAARHTKAVHDALAIDHGSLGGRADDDHPQYYNAARHTKAVHDALNINADTVDGSHASAFAAASHGDHGLGTHKSSADHDSRYLNKAGDTVTGTLTLAGPTKLIRLTSEWFIHSTTVGDFLVARDSDSAIFFRSGPSSFEAGIPGSFLADWAPGDIRFPARATTTNTGLAAWRNDGFPGDELLALSSSIKNKLDVRDAEVERLATAFLAVPLRRWKSALPKDDPSRWYEGWVAEETRPHLPDYTPEPDADGFVGAIGSLEVPMAAAIHQLHRRVLILEGA